METIWKLLNCFVALLFVGLCNGLPIDLDHSYQDSHTQFLTGLIAILLTICGIVCLAGCLCCQRRNGFKEGKNKKEFHDSPVGVSTDSQLDHGYANPLSNGTTEFTIFDPLGTTGQGSSNVFSTNSGIVVRTKQDFKSSDIDVRSWFENEEVEFPRNRLKYIKELGKGWFGRVVHGTAKGLLADDNNAWTPVVVRILEASASTRERALFLNDASIYRCSPHSNLLKLWGRNLDSVPFLLLQEFTNEGDIKSYLRGQQGSKESFLKSDYPLRWCYQLTSALKHLHLNNLVHPDLATRNCRLTETMDLKVGDYGCSAEAYAEDYYHETETVPIRWCAPEMVIYTATTIQAKNATICSNIWSLGVCLWEIYECGAQPYGDLTDDQVISQVLGPPKVRLSKPSVNVLYTDYMYRLMQMSWSTSELRPAIGQIFPMIEDLMQVHQKSKSDPVVFIENFEERWETLKPNGKTDDRITVLDMNIAEKNLSPSLNNLAGSFDNLLDKSSSRTSEEVDNSSRIKKTHLQFELGPNRTSSGSETEDENWKHKIERGAYSEKVRQKSRSVADLMILTHIDCSESDSETPLPSLNYKNVRYAAPKQNLENVSLTFGSEGNLLNVQDTFQKELRKLQVERRDSLLFVPDTISQSHGSPAKRIMEDLNSPSGIEPQNQFFNVFNVVTISPKISPVHTANLGKLINYNDDAPLPDLVPNAMEVKREVPKLSEIIENNIELMDYIIAKYDSNGDEIYNLLPEETHMEPKSIELSSKKGVLEDSLEIPKELIHAERTEIIVLQNVLSDNEQNLRKPNGSNGSINQTQDFLNNEILTYEDSNIKVLFDLSDTQEEICVNSLPLFCSTPFAKKSLQSLDDYSVEYYPSGKKDMNYSLETWDNFLGKSFDELHCNDHYSLEPKSLLFLEEKEVPHNATFKFETMLNKTYMPNSNEDEKPDRTFIKAENLPTVDLEDIKLEMDNDDVYDNAAFWGNPTGGWFLHPQMDDDDPEGEMDVVEDESYVRFGVDDEVMAAIRTELMMKLPQAQRAAGDQIEEGEFETTDRNEVFLQYNCYNTPLSPIPEESYSELLNSGQSTPHCTINTNLGDSDTDWSETGLGPNSLEEDTHSPIFLESPIKGEPTRRTPSQDSCCSNDTLFNLEELQCMEKALQEERNKHFQDTQIFMRDVIGDILDKVYLGDSTDCANISSVVHSNTVDMTHSTIVPNENDNIDCSLPSSMDITVIKVEEVKLECEKQKDCEKEKSSSSERVTKSGTKEESSSSSDTYITASETLCFTLGSAPVNSPEDRPWKHIEASLSKCGKIMEDECKDEIHVIYSFLDDKKAIKDNEETVSDNTSDACYEKEMNFKNTLNTLQNEEMYDCIRESKNIANGSKMTNESEIYEVPTYANTNAEDAVYENLNEERESKEEHENLQNFDGYCPLNDIQFSGPCDLQMMSTSFSDSNDLGEEQDWDSGSDTRSSSSGEFIWKEGEHEASVKALHAAPQNETERNYEGRHDDENSSSGSDEECESPEFVPSAWDKFALPVKSAMRSPEKSLDRTVREGRGVSFKKQKYHCVYEYPREPESPVTQTYELWKNPNYIDWDLDGNSEPYLPGPSKNFDINVASASKNHRNHYNFTETALDDDFYISSSAKPFDMYAAATSQFFPGKHCDWTELMKSNDNVTPDSGVEDVTPGSLSDSSDYVQHVRQILPLKTLAQLAANKSAHVANIEIGGLRHTKNKLKLDLPLSPRAFTKIKTFSLEFSEDVMVNKPSFVNFRSRFHVQQVDTPDDQSLNGNVSFEALPYKPLSKHTYKEELNLNDKSRIEVVRGEASLLDSTDEDSGIESCTLERKKVPEVTESIN